MNSRCLGHGRESLLLVTLELRSAFDGSKGRFFSSCEPSSRFVGVESIRIEKVVRRKA